MKPESARDLLKVDAKDRVLYGNFSLDDLTAYSVHWLTVWDIPTSYENISVLSARLFPQDFGMTGFPELPDGMRTNRSILHMRPKYRGYATSEAKRGVYLTEKGNATVRRVMSAIGAPTLEGKKIDVADLDLSATRSSSRGRSISPAEKVKKARSRILFRRFQEGRLPEMDVVHLLGLLDLYDHTDPKEVRRQFRRLRDDAVALHDEEFVHFMDAAADKFRAYLRRDLAERG